MPGEGETSPYGKHNKVQNKLLVPSGLKWVCGHLSSHKKGAERKVGTYRFDF